jgi:hypothetical protein
MVGAWPEVVLANKYMGYTFKIDSKYRADATAALWILLLTPLCLA